MPGTTVRTVRGHAFGANYAFPVGTCRCSPQASALSAPGAKHHEGGHHDATQRHQGRAHRKPVPGCGQNRQFHEQQHQANAESPEDYSTPHAWGLPSIARRQTDAIPLSGRAIWHQAGMRGHPRTSRPHGGGSATQHALTTGVDSNEIVATWSDHGAGTNNERAYLSRRSTVARRTAALARSRRGGDRANRTAVAIAPHGGDVYATYCAFLPPGRFRSLTPVGTRRADRVSSRPPVGVSVLSSAAAAPVPRPISESRRRFRRRIG